MSTKPTLLILAAGMASRYGSMKQVEGFGPSGETIMDYSIYDAIRSGFGKVVFIIRRDFADDFRALFGPKLRGRMGVEYVFQEMESFLDGVEVPAGRSKPWGTGHAVLCGGEAVKEPFAVINADDFYGREAFVEASRFLNERCSEKRYALIGYQLVRTLSDHGTVSRGVCEVNKSGKLITIRERTKIYREGERIFYEEDGLKHEVPLHSSVSMNFWCFHPSFFREAEKLFHRFVSENHADPKSEFFIPIIAENFMNDLGGVIDVIPTSSQWFGVTYREDAPGVKASIEQLVADGIYPESLWG